VTAAPRVVIDTNVWISVFLVSTGAPARVVRSVLARGLPVFTQATFDELQTRLWKPRFDRYLTIDQRNRLLHDVNACALWVEIRPEMAVRRFSRDRDDDAFVHAALAAQARWLVTGDRDLLDVSESLPFEILTPAQTLADRAFHAATGAR
jgi:putative PIN family toxin of toxin-antitoxin system